ncbi:hypothetical protein QZH41_015989, partial [Actinostola sp. cb2023]
MDANAELSAIEKNGNKPEDWLDFIRRTKRESPKYGHLMDLYHKAARAISPDEHRKNVCYARLLVEYAKLQGMTSAEDAKETFRIARCNVKRFAIVYIAWAQFELDKGNREKCRNHLRKGKTNRAEPSDILDQALKSCDQGNDRLLDDETEELIFTGVVTQTVRSGLPLPTLMSDNELTTEKIMAFVIITDNITDIPPSKSDTGVVSFKLPYTIDGTSKQRQKLSSSSSSGEDTVTAPFHHILKSNRSMSTCKASLKGTPDCRTVGSTSLSSSISLSVRKPSTRLGIGKNFVFLGPPTRGKPSQSLEEVKESTNQNDEGDTMDSFKAIENTAHITTENSKQNIVNISEKLFSNASIDDSVKPKVLSEDYNNQKLSCSNDSPDIPIHPSKTTPMEVRPIIHCDMSIASNHGNTDHEVNMSESRSTSGVAINYAQLHNRPVIDKQIDTIQDVPMLAFNQATGVDQELRVSQANVPFNNGGFNVQAIEKQRQPSQDVQSGSHLESSRTVNQVYPNKAMASNSGHLSQDRAMANSQYHVGMSNQGYPNAVAHNSLGHPIQTLPLSENPNHPGSVGNNSGYPKRVNDDNQSCPLIKHVSIHQSYPSSSNNSNQEHHKHAAGAVVDNQAHLNKNPSYNMEHLQKSVTTNQSYPYRDIQYPVPQTAVGSSNILVNGKSYLKLGTIGRGGSSKVFRAFDGKRVCAVKYVSLEDADDFIVQSYINEISMLKRLQGSDHIITLYDWEQKREENSIILVLECGSIDLAVFLRKNRSTFTETELTAYWKQMLEAVNVIHNEGIIHSDLKPANFLFVEGRLKLIDFGIANAIQADQTSIQRDTQVGTLNFMSPEAFQDISSSSQINPNTGRSRPCTKIGRPSDVWSLGCILYNMVYGRTPFQHITNQAMKLQYIIDENYAIEFPPINNLQLLDVLKGCLIRNPRERYTIPHLLTHPFLSSGNQATEPNEEQLFNCLLELAQARVNSPRSIRVASKSICEQLRSGNKIDLSSFLAKKQQQSQHASRSLRQPLGGLSVEALQAHSSIKLSTPAYMANDRPYFDK